MNSDVIESVLHEILNEQKETGKLSKQLFNKVEHLCSRVEDLANETNNTRKAALITEAKIPEIINEGIENIKRVIAAQQKNIMPEKRIIIFPEFKSPECYKLLFKFAFYSIVASYSFIILKAIVDHWCK